jgi:hypothetical protein
MFSLDKNLEKSNEQVWYKTGFNNKGEHIKLNRFIDIKKCSYILGLFLAEGSFDGNKVTISLHTKERDIARKFVEDISSIFGYQTQWFKEYGNKFYIEFGAKPIGLFFEYFCGNGAHNKELRYNNGFNLETSVIAKDIIDAAFLGYGHTTIAGWKMYTTVSEKYAIQYFSILQNHGLTPTFQRKDRKDKQSIEYVICWLENKKRRHSRKMWYNDFIGTITTITSIKPVDYDDLVYNLEVEEDNTYQLQSFTAHNCSEMLACGLPTIATRCLGHNEYLPGLNDTMGELIIDPTGSEVANDGIWFNGNQGEWSKIEAANIKEKLDLVFNNQSKYLTKNEDLSTYMINNFSWSKAAEKLKTLLNLN